jgi:DNA-binding beta-propeller fold protein YncE
MDRREFARLAALGVASIWLPACSDASSGAPLSRVPTPGSVPGATSSLGSQLATGSSLQSFAPDGSAFAATPLRNYVDFLSPSGATIIARVGDPSRVPTRALGDVSGPVAVAWDDGSQRLLVLEQGNQRIQAFGATGASLGVLVNGVSGSDLIVDRDGTIYVASSLANRIDVFAPSGHSLGSIGAFGTGEAGLNGPASVAVSTSGNVHVVDTGSALVKVFGADGRFVRSYGGAGAPGSRLVGPRSVRIDGAGLAWVADTFGAAICVYDAQGALLSRFTPTFCDGGPAAPTSLCARTDGTIYAAVIAAG